MNCVQAQPGASCRRELGAGSACRRAQPEASDLRENVNNALNATLSRTINTSGTTLVTLLAILFFGGETIRGFIFALALGVVVGTLSTLFVATPIAYGLMKREGLGKK